MIIRDDLTNLRSELMGILFVFCFVFGVFTTMLGQMHALTHPVPPQQTPSSIVD